MAATTSQPCDPSYNLKITNKGSPFFGKVAQVHPKIFINCIIDKISSKEGLTKPKLSGYGPDISLRNLEKYVKSGKLRELATRYNFEMQGVKSDQYPINQILTLFDTNPYKSVFTPDIMDFLANCINASWFERGCCLSVDIDGSHEEYFNLHQSFNLYELSTSLTFIADKPFYDYPIFWQTMTSSFRRFTILFNYEIKESVSVTKKYWFIIYMQPDPRIKDSPMAFTLWHIFDPFNLVKNKEQLGNLLYQKALVSEGFRANIDRKSVV